MTKPIARDPIYRKRAFGADSTICTGPSTSTARRWASCFVATVGSRPHRRSFAKHWRWIRRCWFSRGLRHGG